MVLYYIFVSFVASLAASFIWKWWNDRCIDLAYEQRKAVIEITRLMDGRIAMDYMDAIDGVSLDEHAEALRWRRSLVGLYGDDLCNLMQWD